MLSVCASWKWSIATETINICLHPFLDVHFCPFPAIFAYVCMAQSTICILLTAITLGMYHRKSSVPVPRWLDLVCSRFLSKLFTVNEDERKSPDPYTGRLAVGSQRRRKSSNLELYKMTTGLSGQFNRKEYDGISSVSGLDIIKCRGLPESFEYDKSEAVKQSSIEWVASVSWKTAACLFDRMFFWLSLTVYSTYVGVFFAYLQGQSSGPSWVWNIAWIYRWFRARLQYLRCVSNGDTAVLH